MSAVRPSFLLSLGALYLPCPLGVWLMVRIEHGWAFPRFPVLAWLLFWSAIFLWYVYQAGWVRENVLPRERLLARGLMWLMWIAALIGIGQKIVLTM